MSPPMLIDSHVHLDDAAFDADRTAVLARARDAGIRAQIVPATTAAGWPGLRQLCASHADLHAAYGLHPMFLHEHRREHVDLLRQWLQHETAVAVGECGLDFHVEGLDLQQQRDYFIVQLRIARELALPVIVHARRAVEETILGLRRIGGLRGVIHSFAGSMEQARQLVDMGFMLGIGGPVTYARAKRLRRIVTQLPLQALLLETDAPDQPGCEHRGQRNEPSRLVEVLDCIARLRDDAVEHVAAITSANARELFGLA